MLTDIPLIAPCLPGAQLKSSEGDEHKGVVKIKVGPITAQYSGVVQFVEKDEAGGRAVLSAEGRDTRGAGNARATITATLHPDGNGTRVDVETDLDVTGKVAQFGRGVLGDVSAKLMDQFAECLSGLLTNAAPDQPDHASGPAEPDRAGPGQPGRDSDADDVAVPPTPVTVTPTSATEPVAAVDILKLAGGAVSRRVVPALGGGLLALFLLWRGRRKRRRR